MWILYDFEQLIIFICHITQKWIHLLYEIMYYMKSYILWIYCVIHHTHWIIPTIQVPKLMNNNAPHAFVAINYVPKLWTFGLFYHLFSIDRNCDVLSLLKFCTNKPILASMLRQFFLRGERGRLPKKRV